MGKKKNKKSRKLSVSLLLSLLSVVVSVAALYYSRESNTLAKETIQYANHPNWKHQLVFAENNLDLLRIDFTSPNESVQIQKISVNLPTSVYAQNLFEQYGNSWRSKPIRNLIENAFDSAIGFEEDVSIFGLAGYDECVPIAVTIDYVQFGQARTVTNIYNLIFTAFSGPPIKIRTMEFNLEFNGRYEDLTDYLDFLSCTTCMQDMDCVVEDDFRTLTNDLSDFVELNELLKQSRTSTPVRILLTENSGSKELKDEVLFHTPSYLVSKDALKKYESLIRSSQIIAQENFDKETEDVLNSMEEIFRRANFCSIEEVQCYCDNEKKFKAVSDELYHQSILLRIKLILWNKKNQWN